ncbi:MAG: hypothetical protein KDK70_10350 [Myxococcales bacterium]|nr:hypothetical protein [Myxococcales bacterium]
MLLGLALGGCGPGVDGGSTDDDPAHDPAHDPAGEAECGAADAPVICVGQNGEGCLSVPQGEASCTDGRWTCAEAWTAPQVDPDEFCAVPPMEDCEGEPVICTNQSRGGECGDYWVDTYAFCVDGQWTCPPGFHHDEVHCTWPDWEPEEPPSEDPPGCAPGDEPPPEQADCYDQGPGECADATQPPSCQSGDWVCPPGWDFGNYGEGCTWPQ